MDKYKKMADAAQEKVTAGDKKLISLRKELDSLNRVHKQSDQEGQSKDVRCVYGIDDVHFCFTDI